MCSNEGFSCKQARDVSLTKVNLHTLGDLSAYVLIFHKAINLMDVPLIQLVEDGSSTPVLSRGLQKVGDVQGRRV